MKLRKTWRTGSGELTLDEGRKLGVEVGVEGDDFAEVATRLVGHPSGREGITIDGEVESNESVVCVGRSHRDNVVSNPGRHLEVLVEGVGDVGDIVDGVGPVGFHDLVIPFSWSTFHKVEKGS